jgi:hypothetical protein
MAVSPDVLADINAATLKNYIDKGKVWKQNVSNKPMLKDFNQFAGQFGGGKEVVSFRVRDGRGGGALQGYSYDDQVTYYDPATLRPVEFPWKEHHIGVVLTHTELKQDGIDVREDGTDQTTAAMDGREQFALANRLDEVMDTMGEDYAYSLDRLLHGDGTTDVKAIAGIRSIILDAPATGSTGGLSRVANSWWRNRAATAANASAGGQGAITSSSTGGGALITFMQKEQRQLDRFKTGATRRKRYAGSDFIAAYQAEMRANGSYTNTGWNGKTVDASMGEPAWDGEPIIYDPTLDDLGLNKRMYVLDMGRAGLRLLYMDGQRMKKHNPARPYDRYVMYNGITMTGVLVAKQLNTSGVYDIA